MTGNGSDTINFNAAVPVPLALMALIVASNVPVCAGVPVINPDN